MDNAADFDFRILFGEGGVDRIQNDLVFNRADPDEFMVSCLPAFCDQVLPVS